VLPVPNPKDFEFLFVRKASAPLTLGTIRGRKNHVHSRSLQNDPSAHLLSIRPSFMDLLFNPAFAGITKRTFTISNPYFAHNLIFKNPPLSTKASLDIPRRLLTVEAPFRFSEAV
jgi:hypothetical protein